MILIFWILSILPYDSENWDETGYRVWKIEIDNATKYTTCYSNSKAGTIINESNINDAFESIYSTIISNIQNSLGKDSDWIFDSVANNTANVSKYNPLVGSSYIILPNILDQEKFWLIFKIFTEINALNGVWLETYILQIIIQ